MAMAARPAGISADIMVPGTTEERFGTSTLFRIGRLEVLSIGVFKPDQPQVGLLWKERGK